MQETQKEEETYYKNSRPEMIPFIPSSSRTILEVGCSEGNFGYYFSKSGQIEVWGIELDSESAEKAKSKLHQVVQGDFFSVIDDLPLAFFDCIVFNDVLEHFANPDQALIKVKKHLKPDGKIVCSIPNVRYIGNLYEVLVKKDWEYKSSGILDKTHLRFFTKKSIIKLFNSLDYKVITIEGINPTKSIKTKLLNTIFLNFFDDIKFLEFAVVAEVSKLS